MSQTSMKLHRGQDKVSVPASKLVAVLSTISADGRLEEFETLCDDWNVDVVIDANTVNLLKFYLFAKRFHRKSKLAEQIVGCDVCDW